uniref:Uncharacterized protein n=1 Tax=Neobodo designis TaxID=312471 RepID=A0A6U4UUS9_NEODS|mmetsp:Transcript_42490/g.131208  ORF Transcript_42490/g.131208 Transcript_42490/m.131208 type:complete len:207 (+) Transcript_42490:378-998(+)|eukprot:CAMPEP_0174829838 /NCGR_PEP_ID=MMETSP1114-20130205/2174_1 /TAXON_ID=312471 /ORGANISM="Neobodo designis, Strain CCAP 1951/1" /LENGTH=206 /DNA_ID=CAMNT_0016063607 /DNA_START=377 /DNA_END=997 /DNA_ORIENTATION=+
MGNTCSNDAGGRPTAESPPQGSAPLPHGARAGGNPLLPPPQRKPGDADGAPLALSPFHPDPVLERSGDVAALAASAQHGVSMEAQHAVSQMSALEDGGERFEGRALRLAVAHRSQSPRGLGIVATEPSAAERAERLQRGVGIAYVHGLDARIDQFAPDPVSAEVIFRSANKCRQWLAELPPPSEAICAVGTPPSSATAKPRRGAAV